MPILYQKKPLDIPAQIALLESRGVIISDHNFAFQVLNTVSYYRFSGYLYPFRLKDGTDNYQPDCSFDTAWRYYRFDRRLRCLLIDAIERVEVAVKGLMANHYSAQYGVFGYRNISNYATSADQIRFNELIKFVDDATAKSKEEFIRHFKATYDTSSGLPIWMALEVMTFGNMLTFFRLMKKQDKKFIAKSLGANEYVFESWLTCLNYIRNICAHHGRMWNRHIAICPKLPKNDIAWNETIYPVDSTRIYSVLSILKFLLNHIAPQSGWIQRLYDLLEQFPEIHRISMAMPVNFEKSMIWKS